MVPLFLSAVLALTAVAVADRVEQRLVAPEAAAPTGVDATPADAPSAPGNASPTTRTSLTSAALPAGEMVLTLADGSAAISTGANDPIFELGTTAIGDVDLSGVEPVLAQGDAEVSADWGDVTEWYRPAGDGIEHGYTVDAPMSAGDELIVTVDVVDGEPRLVDEQTIAIERPGAGVVWYRGLFAFDANGTDLPAEMAVVDGDIELRVDTAGAEYPITIDPTISELQKLFADPDAAGDRFGESVAIDGVPGDMTIVVGAVGDDGEQGVVYVFRNEGFGWAQQAKLYPPTPGDRQFGWDVDVRGDVVVVGAPGDDANGADAGAVYVFETAGPFEPWQQTSVVYQCDPSVAGPCGETAAGTGFDGAGFGFAVDLTDEFLLVGAPGFQGSQGGAWVYQRSGNDWQTSTAGVLGRTDLPAAGDEFGYAVAGADAGTHIVVGAPGDDNFVGIDAGRTFYFQWDGLALSASAPVLLTSGNTADGNTGAHVEVEIDADGDAWMFSGAPVNTRFEDGTEPGVSYSWRYVLPAGADPLGTNLLNYGSSAVEPAHAAFTGAHVLYADYLADGSATDAGSALYFPVIADDGEALNRLGSGLGVSLPANAGDRWGFDVAASGDTYVIGGPGNDAAGTDAGEVRIGSFSDPGFVEVLSPDPSFDPARLGTAVVVDGDRMVASAPFESAGASGAGVVYVYERAGASAPWALATSIASPDPEFRGGFGDALDLRGPLLAIGESDRFGDGAEPGRVWVYAFTGSSWELQGPVLAPAIEGAENGDQFGASLAWIDETVLAIGAPGTAGSTGRVALVNDTGAGWNITEVTTPADVPGFPGVEPVAGDQFGFDIATGNGDLSGTNLFVGAPGRDDSGSDGGAVYRFVVVEGNATWTNSFGYAAGGRIGTSVDTSGDRAVAAGYGGGTLTVQILEYISNPDPLDTDRPFVWTGDGGVSVGVGFIPEDGPINDYVALDGTTIAVGRPGGGGSVAVFQRGASGWPTVPDVDIVPAGRRSGDRIGHAIALDTTTLVIGAPGDNGVTFEFPNSGAVYSTDLPGVATWTGDSPAGTGLWSDPDNWDVLAVPGVGDTAIVPPGVPPVEVDVDAAVAELFVDDSTVNVGTGFTLESDSTTILGNGQIYIAPEAELVLRNDALVDGFISVDEFALGGLLTLDGAVAVSGTGTLVVRGALDKIGLGTATVDVDRLLSDENTVVSVMEGTLELTGADLRDGRNETPADGLVGEAFVAAGAELRVNGDLTMTDASSLGVDIDGDASPGSYGRITVTGTLTKDGSFFVNDNVGLPIGERYDLITCGDCRPGAFADLPTEGRTEVTQNAVTLVVVSLDPPPLSRLTQIGSGDGTDVANEVAVDVFGNTLVAGFFTGAGGPGGIVSAGGEDAYVASYDPAGALRWAVPFGGSGNDNATAVDTDVDGNVYVAGQFSGSVTFDPDGLPIVETSLGARDIFVVKYDTDGDYQWTRVIGGAGDSENPRLAVGSDRVHIASGFTGAIDTSPNGGGVPATATGTDTFLTTLDSRGLFLWSNTIGSSGDVFVADLAVDQVGGVYAAGSFSGTLDSGVTSAGGSDGWLAEYLFDGSLSTLGTIGGAGNDALSSVAPNASGLTVYAAGAVAGSADIDPGPGVTNLTTRGVILELGQSGDLVDSFLFDDNAINAVRLDPDGNVVFNANFDAPADIDPGLGVLTVPFAGFFDVLVGELDPTTGDLAWGGSIGGPGLDQLLHRGLAVSPSGNVVLAGWFIGTSDFDPSSGLELRTAGAAGDGFVLQLGDVADTGSITGQVLDPAGNPFVGATVFAQSDTLPVPASGTVVTPADGTFALTGLPIGSYVVSVFPPPGSGLAQEWYPDSFDTASAVFVPTDGPPLEIRLNELGTVSGVLIDPFGTPQEGVNIFATRYVPTVGWVQDGPAGVTDGTGSYTLELAPGRWAVCAYPAFGSGLLGSCIPEGWTVSTPGSEGVLVEEGVSITDANLQFVVDNRALINVTLFDEFGAPATGNLRVLAACTPPADPVLSAALCSSGSSASFAQFSPPDPFDQFSVRLPAGTYNVAAIVSPDGGATGQISDQTSFTVADGEEFDCTFTMNGAASCVAFTPRFVGGVSQNWDDAANWSDGKVPGPDARVVIPDGVGQVEINSSVSVASVQVEGLLTVLGSGSLTLTGGPTADQGSVVAAGGVFIVSGPIDAVAGIVNDGTVVANGATFGAADNGTFVNRNEFVAGPAPGEFIDIIIPWESSASSLVDVLPNRDTRFAASYTELGRVILRAGADLELAGDVTLGATARIFVDVIGVSSPANFGRLLASGVLTVDPGATLFTNPTAYTPTIFDRYTVVDCGSSPCEPFTNTQIGPFAQTLVDGDLVLALPTVVPTFVNDSFGASWNDPVNWSTGIVPTSGSALVPDGAAPRIYPGTSVALDRVTVEGDLFVDDALTVASLDVPVGGIVWAEPGSTVSVAGPVTLDGEISVRSTLALGNGTSVVGSGLVINNGTITTDGTVTLDDPVSVNSGTTSVLDVQTGTLDVQTTGFDPRGVIRVGADATAAFAGDVILRPSSVIEIEVVGSSSFGSLAVAGTLGFAPYGVGEPADTTLAHLVAPYSGSSPIDIILCGDCSGALFDEFDLGAATASIGATAITLSTVNTFIGTGLLASWSDPTNWLYGFVPTAGEAAVVPAGRTATIQAGSVAVLSDTTVDGTLDIDGTAWLGDAIISGTGNVDNNAIVLSNGDTSIGPDLTWTNTGTSIVRVETGVLDIEDADFDTGGTVAVDAGASVLIQNDWTAEPTSVLEFEITGPAASTVDYGQFELQSGTFTAAGTLRATFDSYAPTFDDVYAVIRCGSSCAQGTFDVLDLGTLEFAPSVRVITLRGPEVVPELAFDLNVAAGDGTVTVAPAGIAVSEIDRAEIAARGGGSSSVAASSITEIGVEDTGIASIAIGATPLSSIVLESVPLSSIPLVNIDVEGGWSEIVALWENVPSTLSDGSPNPQFADLSREPLSSLTFGQVLSVGDPTDEDTPAGRIAASPLSSIDVDGTPLSSIPLSSIALGTTPLSSIDVSELGLDWCDIVATIVPNCQPADLTELTLMEVTLRGVPLSSIPLSSIPLSSIPLSSIPLSSIPLSSIDLSASPLSSIPLSSIPLSSIPLSSIDVNSAPLSSIPLSSIPLSSIPLSSIPLSSIPLSSIAPSAAPLSSIPLSSIPLSSIGVEGAPLSSIPLSSIPLSSIPLSSIPLSSIPLSSIALADTPLSSIPLSSIDVGSTQLADEWCRVLAAAGVGFDCTTGADPSTTTLRQLSLAGVPLSSIPLSSIPLSSIPLSSITIGSLPLSSIPLSSIPLSSIPLSSIPLSSIPLSSIELGATPLSSIPLSSIPLSSIDVAGSPLSSIPLSSIPLSSIPLSSIPLSSIPLSSIPLSSIPLSSIILESATVNGAPLSSIPLSSIPLSSIDVAGSPLSSIPLSSIPLSSIGVDCLRVNCVRGTVGDAFALGAFPPATTLAQIQSATEGIRLGELAPFIEGVDVATLLAAIEASGTSLADLVSLDDMTLGDIAAVRSVLADVLLGELELAGALDGLSFDDIANAIIDPATGKSIPGTSVLDDIRRAVSRDGTGDVRFLDDLLFLGDFTVGDLIDAGVNLNRELTLGEIEPVLGFVTVKALEDALGIKVDLGTRLLGQLSAEELEFLTLNDLLALTGGTSIGDLLTQLDPAEVLSGFTLGDLLLALVDPASLTYGGIEFAEVDVAALPEGTVPAATFSADFTMTASTPRSVELEVSLPTSAGFVPGSATVNGVASDPEISGRTLTWTVPAQPGNTYQIAFDVLPSLRLGATSLNATARIVGTGVVVPASAQLTVAEGLEPNDFLPKVVEAAEDFVYLTYISSAEDYDVFAIEVAENDVLVAELSNLDADLDMVLWTEKQAGSSAAALTAVSDEKPIIPITDPDAVGGDSEAGDDFPRLDEIVATSGIVGLPELSLVATSNGPGTANEFLKSQRLAAGRYYIQVYGANGAVTVDPAALQLKVIEADTRPVCRDIQFLANTEGAEFGVAPSQAELAAANTLILLNESRLERLYGATGRQTVVDAANSLVAYLSNNPLLGIDAVVVPVDGYQSVRDAYVAFDADGCVPAKANAVVAEINRVIDPYRDNLEHIAILGGDDLIPMARLDDATTVANEYDYRGEFDGDIVTGVDDTGGNILSQGRTALTAAAWDSMILSDEPYGDAAARSLGDRFLYVTDVALGRVVETPDEIADALSTFETFGGQLDIDTAAVLGYDFLSDGSAQIADKLDESLGAANVDRQLAEGLTVDGRKWNKDDATDKLIEQGTQALVSLNAHFDHYRALPALGDQVPNFNDNLIATAVETAVANSSLGASLNQSLIFSMGCHSGLSVSDIMIGRTNQDWAQTLGRQGALYVGNTGFGYGDTETVAYTEQLMALFAEQVTSPLDLGQGAASSTVGQALAWAKNEYVAGLQSFSVYDEKALMESTFYGLPFYRVGRAIVPEPLPLPPTNTTAEDGVTQLESLTVIAEPDVIINEPVEDAVAGTYYRNFDADGDEQVIVAPGRPIQPKTVTDISVVGTDTTKLAQVARGAVVTAMTSTYVELPNPVVATPVFDEGVNQPEPEPLPSVFPLKPLEIVTTNGPAGTRQTLVQATGQYQGATGIQRLDDDIETVVYYAEPGDTDVIAPTIAEVSSTVGGGTLRVSLKAGRLDAPDLVKRVVVLVAQDPTPGTQVELVSFDLQRRVGSNVWDGQFALDPTTSIVEFSVQAVDQAGNVGYASNKTEGYPAAVAADPVVTGVVAPLAPAVRSDGVEVTVEFTDPTGVFDVYDIEFDWGDGSTSGALVTPPTSTNPGTATARRTYAAPGRYDVTVTVTDSAGGTSTSVVEVVVYEPGAAPVITDVVLAGVVAVGDPVDLSASFGDGSAGSGEDTFSARVDWGDSTVVDPALVTPPVFGQDSGSVSSSHTYQGAGTFSVTVTVDDGTGRTATRTAEIEVVSADSTAPTVNIAAPADGATYTESEVPAPVFTCTDADSSVSSCEIAGYSTATGEHTASVTGVSAGGTASASVTYLVIPDPGRVQELESAEPLADVNQLVGATIVVSASGFAPGEDVEIFLYSDPVLLATTAADDAGTATAAVTIPESTSIGAHAIVFVGTATGRAKSTPVQVVDVIPSTFSGFYSPVTMGEVNVVKAGRAVPIKFNVDQRGEVTDPALLSITVHPIDCLWVSGVPQETVAYSFAGGSDLRWTGSEFQGNVKLDGGRNQCRLVVAGMLDGSGSVAAVFRLK